MSAFPLGVFCVVTGVSGSGKSTLIEETLHPALQRRLGNAALPAAPYTSWSAPARSMRWCWSTSADRPIGAIEPGDVPQGI